MTVAALGVPPGAELSQICASNLILRLYVQCTSEQKTPRDVVQMNRNHAFGMIESKYNGNDRAPVATLRAETLIAKLLHESHPECRNFLRIHTSLARTIGKPIAWQ